MLLPTPPFSSLSLHDALPIYRHRLNTVMFRRTKADACQPDGSPLFARRWVHTESFVMSPGEKLFYERLREYLEEGFDLARRDRKSTRLNSSHVSISYAVFCLK